MKDFSVAFPNTLNTFPNTLAKNSTSPTLTDGTPLISDFYNDWWGFVQAAMTEGNETPSGDLEVDDDSQLLDSLKKILSPVGAVLAGMWNDDPAVLGARLLRCVGQGVLVANYADLVAATYVGDADNPSAEAFYRSDDAGGFVRNTNGIYFILPDFTGAFLRESDASLSYDPYGDRTMGEARAPYTIEHEHEVSLNGAGATPAYLQEVVIIANPGVPSLYGIVSEGYGSLETHQKVGEPIEANDLAPRNIMCQYAIRY